VIKLPSGEWVNPRYVVRCFAREKVMVSKDVFYKPNVAVELTTGMVVVAESFDFYGDAKKAVDNIAISLGY